TAPIDESSAAAAKLHRTRRQGGQSRMSLRPGYASERPKRPPSPAAIVARQRLGRPTTSCTSEARRAEAPMTQARAERPEARSGMEPAAQRRRNEAKRSGQRPRRFRIGAGNGIRTRDFDLGKVALYH